MRLSDFVGASVQAPKALEAIKNPDCGWFYRRDAETFRQIPGAPIAYWASENAFDAFSAGSLLRDVGLPRQGLATGENDRFLRAWWEVPHLLFKSDCGSLADASECGKKWFPYNKGGDFRRWYGNYHYVIAFDSENRGILSNQGNHLPSRQLYFRPSITWSLISSSVSAFRYRKPGSLFDVAGMSMFPGEEYFKKVIALCNSSVTSAFLSFIAPTINYQAGDIAKIPYFFDEDYDSTVDEIVDICIAASMADYDSFETSWDFKRHPLL